MGAAAGVLGIAGMKARGHVTSNPPPNANIEDRVVSLERNVGHLNKRIDDAFQELDKAESEQTAALEREKQERVAEDTKIASKLETSGTGGLHISAIGALWLLIGRHSRHRICRNHKMVTMKLHCMQQNRCLTARWRRCA